MQQNLSVMLYLSVNLSKINYSKCDKLEVLCQMYVIRLTLMSDVFHCLVWLKKQQLYHLCILTGKCEVVCALVCDTVSTRGEDKTSRCAKQCVLPVFILLLVVV